MTRRRRLLFLGVLAFFIAAALVSLSARPERIRAGGLPLPWTSPPGYRIVYLLADEALAAESLMAPSRLEATLGARTVFKWDELLALDKSAPIDALVVHDSALPMVDRDWIVGAYGRGVVIGAFNVHGPEVAELLRDPCIATEGFASEPYPGAFWVIVSRLVVGQPEDVALIKAASDFCGKQEVVGVGNQAGEHFGRSQNSLLNVDDYNVFARILVDNIEDIRQLKQEFGSG